MPEPPSPTLSRRLRHLSRVYRAPIAVTVLLVGILLTVLAIGAYTPLKSSAPFTTIDSTTNQSGSNGPDYNLIFVIAGPILIIIGGYLVGAYYYARQRFEHLMLSKSKAEFLRNLPEVEDLLWDLTPADEQRYETKKAELRVRR
jgi:NADH:ubiquinone oxidoreductase subunit 5 (subunit L)/multisubunit Na+/H+ antiporter MnhA subunit